MNIQTVAENLKNTIKGKQAMLDGLNDNGKEGYYIIKQWLEINIDELTKILTDVEQCVFDYDELKEDLKEANGRVRQLERENSDMGWQINPDRMGQ
jgi:hypothetical protein